jgi:hypothetical protein
MPDLAAGSEVTVARRSPSATASIAVATPFDAASGRRVLTHAFTGRLARLLPNEFIVRFEAIALLGYRV